MNTSQQNRVMRKFSLTWMQKGQLLVHLSGLNLFLKQSLYWPKNPSQLIKTGVSIIPLRALSDQKIFYVRKRE